MGLIGLLLFVAVLLRLNQVNARMLRSQVEQNASEPIIAIDFVGADDLMHRNLKSDASKVRLKLWWQSGYKWQGSEKETKWCMRCRGSKCVSGTLIIIVDCDTDSPTRFSLENYGSDFLIKAENTNLCLELNDKNKNYYLKGCKSSNSLQTFASGSGSHKGSGKFEIYPQSKEKFCVTQRHHPKYGEAVRAESCDLARQSDTHWWIKY